MSFRSCKNAAPLFIIFEPIKRNAAATKATTIPTVTPTPSATTTSGLPFLDLDSKQVQLNWDDSSIRCPSVMVQKFVEAGKQMDFFPYMIFQE